MKKHMFACLLAVWVLVSHSAIADKTESPAAETGAIAELIQRLHSTSATEREAATQELIKIGKPAAKALVVTLSDPSQATREVAATALRELFARRKDATPNDHGEAYWKAAAAKIKVGDRRTDVYRLLPPNPPMKPGQEYAGSVMGSGQSHTEWYRLDDYWSVSIGYHNPDTVASLPSLRNDPKQVWVAPQKNYTGEWNSWFVNGRKATCNHFKDGKYHGIFAWYRTNGRLLFQQQFKDGVITGDEVGWHEDGRKSYTGQYDMHGHRTGKWTHWYETGQMHSRTEFLAGKKHGLSESWHPNGQLQYQVYYKNDIKHGVDRAFDSGGAVHWERFFRDGELVER